MPTRTITITEDAYRHLFSRKQPGDSFSDVINKTMGGSSLLDIAGILTKQEAEELREHIKERRKAQRSRMERIARALR